MQDILHIYPTDDIKPHKTDDNECWCNPKYYKQCQQCGDEEGCWACDGGIIEVESTDTIRPLMVVHNKARK